MDRKIKRSHIPTETYIRDIVVLGKSIKVLGSNDIGTVDPTRDGVALGTWDSRMKTIRIFTGNKEYEYQDIEVLTSFLHELTHAILDGVGILGELIDNGKEETFITTFCPVLADTLTRNKLINTKWRKKK